MVVTDRDTAEKGIGYEPEVFRRTLSRPLAGPLR
jgi:hypothetical protein